MTRTRTGHLEKSVSASRGGSDQSPKSTKESKAPNALPKPLQMNRLEALGNGFASLLAKVGVGPFHLLTTTGRKTGLPRTTPVTLVEENARKWLVAPYGPMPWVLNARAAGRVSLRRGRTSAVYEIREVDPAKSGPILKKYVEIARATRPYFWSDKDAPSDDFAAEGHLHPVFELIPPS